MIKLGQIGASFSRAAEPCFLALGAINGAVRRYDRVYKLATRGGALVFAISFSFSFTIYVFAPFFANLLLISRGGALSNDFSEAEMETHLA